MSVSGYRGHPSDHFDGERFLNPNPVPSHGFLEFLRWSTQRSPGAWRPYADEPPGAPPPRRVGPGELRITFVNHATLLVQTDGMNVLTDPIWSERASPVSWMGPKRARPPGIRFEDLPPIDVVVVSHAHYDHLDLATLERLARAHGPRFFVPLGARSLLERRGIGSVAELDWWQSVPLSPAVELTMVPAQHFHNRGLFDRNRVLWGGYVLKSATGATYFAGDTGFGPHFEEIAKRLGPIRVALLPIGAYKPRWFMSSVHISPAEAVEAARRLGVEAAIAMHFGTFRLADDGQDEPVRDLRLALQEAPDVRFEVLPFGGGLDFPGQVGSLAR